MATRSYAKGNKDYPLFSLVHGRRLSDAYWEPLQEELADRGFPSIAHYLPVTDGYFSFEHHARILCSGEQDTRAKKIVRVAHSWGVNPGMRCITEQVVAVDIIAGVAHPRTVHPDRVDLLPKSGEEHSMTYKMMSEDDELLGNEDIRRWTFFNGVDPAYVEQYDRFREHPKREDEPQIAETIAIPTRYIMTWEDRVVPRASQLKYADALGAEVVNPESEELIGHMPMLSTPGALADIIVAPWLELT